MSGLQQGFARTGIDAGQVVFEQGAPNTGIFCVSTGLIALRSLSVEGRSTLLRLAYPGEIIGYRSFLGDGVHRTEAKALIPSRVCAVTGQTARRIVQANPEVLARMTDRCLQEIDRTHSHIISAATVSNKDRLADLLDRLMLTHGETVGSVCRMRLPLSRADLADLLGVQRETISRIIARLEQDGVFSLHNRDVVKQLTVPPLRAVANG